VKKQERIAAVFTSLGGVMVMIYAWRILKLGSIHVPDAGFLPFLCGLGLTILGMVWGLTLRAGRGGGEGEAAEERRWRRPLLSLFLMVLYGLAIETAGYLTSTLAFMIAWQQFIEHENWFKTMAISILGTLAMYVLFSYLLKVPVPAEFFVR
jgi:hypothetical protein